METIHSKYIIVGAGLSGLTTAHALLKAGEEDFIITEARNRIGGRINTIEGVDLGATWFQDHHSYLSELLDDLPVDKFEQYSEGKSVLVYNTMAPAHYFESQHNGPSAYRIVDGSIALIEKLVETLSEKIHLNTPISAINENQNLLNFKSANRIYSAEKAIITIPPKLASALDFNPELPESLLQTMKFTHTWMSNAMKVGILFDTPFWRKKDFSGTIIGQVGPVIELYDHCDYHGNTFGLMGFVNEGLRDTSPELRKEKILNYLEKYLGKEIQDHTSYLEKDWSMDRHTSCENLKSVYMSPQYGHALYNEWYLNGKLFFSGTETSPIHGGYLDGAVYSGFNAAKKLMEG
ncbi:NAD(P)/FAD-dependent oxidoreductase [uncultured Allomuricauda sp.]|uniref:flavin monoamine oxidase family protein n=1 Tax=Flagellimonas sp. W118 TaxID=3410791 RepID=UPI00261FCB20|nr:NAD(P)/FAD-dependent oxidoreductase [uncultured Allomuricauda sp.]